MAACPFCAPMPEPGDHALCGRQTHSIDTVVLSTQHSPTRRNQHKMKASFTEAIIEEIIKPVLPKEWLAAEHQIPDQPTGRFVIGGPQGDCGLTGRKIIVDTYGGACPTAAVPSAARTHEGGPLCRLCRPLRGQEHRGRRAGPPVPDPGGYAIGVARPMNVTVYTRRHGCDPRRPDCRAGQPALRPAPKGIIQMLDLLRPSTARPPPTVRFGREEPEFTWERTDKVQILRDAAGLK